MSYAGLHPHAFLALRTTVKNNAHFVTDSEILYPAGALLILHDYLQEKQRYIQLMEKSIFLEMIVVSPTRSLAAIIINDEKGHIVIYDLKSLKKIRTLNLPHDATTKRFEHMCFSHDEKLLLTITGDPDWLMLSYNWEKGKVETFTRGNYINNPGPVSQVLSSPSDSAVCCILGPALFRLMTMQETVWRQYGFQKADQVNVTSAAFLGSDRVIVGTSDGRLLLIDSGELKAVHDAATVDIITVPEKEEGSSTQPVQIPKSVRKDTLDRHVRAITPFNKGFAYSCGVGNVYMFENEGKHVYRKRNLLTITDPDYRQEQNVPLNIVQHMSINVTQDKLLATTNRSQIYAVKLWGPNLTTAAAIEFEHLGESLHHGPVSGLAMCVWKPVFMTCGAEDRTVRLWNYKTAKLEMLKQYEEDVLSVALHPTALFAAIGFKDKLRYMIVLLDDIQPCRTFPISDCHISAFSSNGHYLAAVNRLDVVIYSTISFYVVCNLKGHSANVTSLSWTPDDSTLVSCGTDGAVYEWDVASGSRRGEIVNKEVAYWECAVTADGKFIYAVGSDGKLKEIRDSNVLRVFGFGQKDLPHVVMSRSDLIMYICADSGCILSVKMPLIEPIDRKSFLFHNSKILKMKMTYDDGTVVTVSETGSLCIWNVTEADGRTIEMDESFSYCSDVLIPKIDLEDKVGTIYELSQRMQELIMEQDYRIRQTEGNHANTIKEIHASYGQIVKQLKNDIDVKNNEHSLMLTKMTTEIKSLRQLHETAKQEIETKFNAMLIVEYEKLNGAEKDKEAVTEDYEKKIAEIIRSHEETAETVRMDSIHKISALEAKVKQLMDENEQERLEHAEIKERIEDDVDREIVELKADYEKILRGERELYAKVRGEEGVMRKKLGITVKENEKYKHDLATLQNELCKSQGNVSSLMQDINDLKKEIYERDLTIQEKEKRIYDMKKITEELEKYKFVLGHKIQELKNQLEPKENELEEKDKQITQMEWEMIAMQKENRSMEMTFSEQTEKLNAADKEIRKLKEKCDGLISNINKVGTDIMRVSNDLQDPKKLKDGVRNLHEKYAQRQDVENMYNARTDVESELQRQHHQLQQTVDTLTVALTKARRKSSDSPQLMKENVMLIEEVNALRKLNKEKQDKLDRYENILLSSTGRIISLSDARKKLEYALKSKEDIRMTMQAEIDRARREANMLQDELNRLRRECRN